MSRLTYENFISLALQDSGFVKITDSIRNNPDIPVSVTGPSDPHKTYLLNSLSEILEKKLCVLVPDELRARSIVRDFSGYKSRKIVSLRQRELNFLDIFAASREDELERLGTLAAIVKNNFDVCVVTAQGSLIKLPSREKFLSASRELKPGDEVMPDKLKEYLPEIGYERVKTAESPGQFAARGDIIDIVLPEQITNPESDITGIRISFFDDTVDSIKEFDVTTQRSLDMKKNLFIYPAREAVIEKEDIEKITSAILKGSANSSGVNIENDIERIEQGNYFSVVDRYLWAVYESPGSVFDYFDSRNTIIAADEPSMINNRMDAFSSDFYEKFKSFLEKKKVVPKSCEGVFSRSGALSRFEKIPGRIYFSVIPSNKSIPANAVGISIDSKEIISYRGREKELAKTMDQRQKDGLLTVLMAGNSEKSEKISEYLMGEGINPVVAPLFIDNGFEYPGAGILFVGSRQIFGSGKKSGKKHKKGISIDLFSDLEKGELVVHEDHGIGRFMGIANIESNGSRRDYLKIDYHKSDSLYIPVESLDKIQKYVGSKSSEPRLSKLGGKEWGNLKERARSSIKKLATDLIALYAKRMSAKGYKFSEDTVWQKEFEDDFEYVETPDQLKSIAEIKADMESEKVMDRLLCGDVGFGKTEVAFRALFKCVMDGKQVAVLVPTTVLAQQHYDNLKERLREFPVRTGLLSRFASDAMIKNTKKELADGTLEIVIGTHRVLSKDVKFRDLGLIIIDEEQRFGVDHKEKLKELFPRADVLTLTATPIPRTLHMSLSRIRDISIIEDPPEDRHAVQTYVMEYDEDIISEAMLREISRKGQVFYLYNNTARIAEKAMKIEKMLPEARVMYAHGKMGERQLENIISSFVNFEADILVCTTIIESGVDMPNVNTIIVENSHRLGLAQLYQLRGRVGRSNRQAYSYITYTKDMILSETARKRLAAIRDYTELGSGFKIALKDLEVRGAGNLLGAMQHGNMDAIGYDMYCRILDEEIKTQSGNPAPVPHTATVEFRIDAYIPKNYIPDESQRMDMYRKIGRISDSESYMDVQDELSDRFGELPDQIITLTDIAYIKGYAPFPGFDRIWDRDGSVILSFRKDYTPDMELVSYILGLKNYKGMILFNAQANPYLVLRKGATPIEKSPEKVRKLFQEIEKRNNIKEE